MHDVAIEGGRFSVTLVHRRDVVDEFAHASSSVAAMRRCDEEFIYGQTVIIKRSG